MDIIRFRYDSTGNCSVGLCMQDSLPVYLSLQVSNALSGF